MPERAMDLEQAVRQATSAANNPALRRHVENVSGVQLNRVAEVVLGNVTCESGCELRLSDIATRLGVELSSVSRKVQKMEADGLVARTCDPSDARAYRLRITTRGEAHLGAVRSARSTFVEQATASWSSDDRAALIEMLTRLANDIEKASKELG